MRVNYGTEDVSIENPLEKKPAYTEEYVDDVTNPSNTITSKIGIYTYMILLYLRSFIK